MRKRRLLLCVGVVACLGLVGFLLWSHWPADPPETILPEGGSSQASPADRPGPATPPVGPGVTRATFEKIREGMSLEEVTALLGPPDPYGYTCYICLDDKGKEFTMERRVWGSKGRTIRLMFKDDGVCERQFSGPGD